MPESKQNHTASRRHQINRRDFLKTIGCLTAVVCLQTDAMPALFKGTPPKRPNILFIFADDQDFQAIQTVGGEVHTPNLDRLVNNSVTFSHAYNPGSWANAVCVASRTMLNTGRFLWNAQRVDQNEEKAQGRFWSQCMKQAGYDTYFSGKWHVRADVQQLFDTVRNVRPGMPNVFPNNKPHAYDRPHEHQKDTWDPTDPAEGGFWEGGRHWSEVLGDDGVDFIRLAAQQDNPFFMYLAFNAPHDPRQSPKAYVQRYPQEEIKIPESFLPEYPYNEDIGSGRTLRDERLAPFPRTDYAVRVHRSEYYAIISHMDTQIGRILDELEKQGLDKNTYVFFTADHGLAVGQHGLFGKQNMYDHSVRVPFMVTGPGIQPGTIESPVYLQDIVPTTLELAGAGKPSHVQFRSLLPLMRGRQERTYDAIYGAYLDLQRMVTADGFKLILYPKIKKVLLFDLQKDPHEMTDLAVKPEYQEKVRLLFEKLLRLQEELADSLDLRTIYPALWQ